MIRSLIRGKQFNRGRLLGKYWRVILDGTGLFCFKEKHCSNCLCVTKKSEDGKPVLSSNVIVSIGTEFIENEQENVSK